MSNEFLCIRKNKIKKKKRKRTDIYDENRMKNEILKTKKNIRNVENCNCQRRIDQIY